MNTAVLVTCIRNFHKNRGPVSGILKGYVGLSTAIFTDVCSALFSDSPASFLVMLAVVPFAVCLTAMVFLRDADPAADAVNEKEETRYFNVFNVVAMTIAVYLLAFDLSGRHSTVVSQVFAAVLLLLLAAPLGVPVYIYLKSWRTRASDIETQVTQPFLVQENVTQDQTPDEQANEAAVQQQEEVGPAEGAVKKKKPTLGEDHTIIEAFATLDFWILFVSFLCGVGTGMAVMNNMGQMGLALGYVDISIFVSLISIWGFFGRIGSGSISEYFIRLVTSLPSST
ncbi:hypothetical protein ACLOJK_025671 [Asimina triloba]